MSNKTYECPDCGDRFDNDFDEFENIEHDCGSVLELDQDGDLISIDEDEDDEEDDDY